MALTRKKLIDATKALLWERGYADMSPRDVLDASGAGQGSLYHHFKGKAELAATAMQELEAEQCQLVDRVLQSDQPPLARLRAYLTQPREALKGCRLGRLASDPQVVANDDLRAPIAALFTHQAELLEGTIRAAQAAGELRADLDAAKLAHMIIATIQGGYTLARAFQDSTKMRDACEAAVALLDAAQP